MTIADILGKEMISNPNIQVQSQLHVFIASLKKVPCIL